MGDNLKNFLFSASYVLLVAIAALCSLCLMFTTADKAIPEPETLIDTPALAVTHTGPLTVVHDRAGARQYRFIAKRVRRSAASREAVTVVSSSSVEISTAANELTIRSKTDGKVYIIHYRRGVSHDAEKNQ